MRRQQRENISVGTSRLIMAAAPQAIRPSIRKTGIFLMADIPRHVVERSYKKTRQKINVSLARLVRALLAHSGW
jgi:hypothetical protein